MKKILSFLFAVFISANIIAQAPNKMSYQSVIRNTTGALVTNQIVGVQISILQGSSSGTAVYVETQTPQTNANGLASFEIGAGNIVTGTMAAIDWSAGPYFIKTETDPTGGTSYTITGTSELLSVPYALNAANGNWNQNGSAIYNSNSGSVGVGTTAPASKFNVVDSSTINAIEITNKNSAGFSTTSFTNETGGFQAAIGYSNSASSLFPGTTFFNSSPDIIIGTQNAERMRITTLGNVGIGTSTPDRTLVVSNTGTALNTEVTELASAINDTNFHLVGMKGETTNNPGDAMLKFGMVYGNNGVSLKSSLIRFHRGIAGNDGDISFSSNDDATEIMRLTSSGNAGIGTTTPAAKLDVAGNVKIADGTQGAGKVLTSDANGFASWQVPQTAIAYGLYANGALSANYGIASVTHTSIGNYEVNCAGPLAGNANVVATIWDTNTFGFISYYQVGNNTVYIRIRDAAGADMDASFSLVVFGY